MEKYIREELLDKFLVEYLEELLKILRRNFLRKLLNVFRMQLMDDFLKESMGKMERILESISKGVISRGGLKRTPGNICEVRI